MTKASEIGDRVMREITNRFIGKEGRTRLWTIPELRQDEIPQFDLSRMSQWQMENKQ